MMKVTYDQIADAAYIYLRDIEPGGVKKTYACDADDVDGTINLDFDAEGKLIGIEVLGAKAKLPEQVIANADDNE